MQIYLIIALVVAILSVVFAVQNTAPVTVSLLGWKFESSLALVLLVTFALGVVTSLLVSIPAMVKRRRRKIRELRESYAREAEGEAGVGKSDDAGPDLGEGGVDQEKA
ncbi:MAG: LapA family protein [Candidatus Latescibacteria bacterium]|jgi:uncharacterized integral membrane protein|nr:LapA family protein [Candidatus Latescibacterota bacterium]